MNSALAITVRTGGFSALLLSLSAGPAAAREGAGAAWFHDGARRIAAERTGPAARDALGRALTPVRLRYAGRRAPIEAFVDATAIVRIAPGGEADAGAAGIRLVRPLMSSIGLWLAEDARGGDGLDLAERLGGDATRPRGVRAAVPNLYLRVKAHSAPFTPNDPRFPGQWYFKNLRMTEAWGLTQGDESMTVVVIDSGCDPVHPDLASKLDPGLDVVDGDNDPSFDPTLDGASHGTSCAGIIAAATDNGEGIAGACPACRLRCVRMIDDSIQSVATSVEAFDFALQVDAAVVSNSWGYVDPIPVPTVLADAIQNVFQNGRGGQGALVIFAAGNDDREVGDDELQALPTVLSIGAVNQFDDKVAYTNFGASLDLVAPAGTVTTDIAGPAGADPSDYTSMFGGTSSACPVAAGIAGLLASAAPERTSADLYDVLIRTARPAPLATPDANGHDLYYGYGVVEPVGALEELGLGGEPPPAASEDSGCSIAARGAGGGTAPGAAIYAMLAAAACARRRRRR